MEIFCQLKLLRVCVCTCVLYKSVDVCEACMCRSVRVAQTEAQTLLGSLFLRVQDQLRSLHQSRTWFL